MSGAVDPFAELGLARSFGVDRGAAERAYLMAASRLHPDLAAGDPGAAGRMAALNEARAIVLDPERRAGVLVSLLGGPGGNEERGLPDGFLSSIMQTRMALEEAVEGGDAGEVARWRGWAQGERARFIEEVGRAFEALSRPPRPEELRAIRVTLNAWRYIERMRDQLPG